PNIANVTDGVGEDEFGMDENGPFGGNDGLNMALLPADAPLRIYADGFRNPYDLVWSASGNLYTVDNGSNGGFGGDPILVDGKATNQPNNGGTGDPEPLFSIKDGGYYGHAAPARSNQTLSWTAYNNSGTPDGALSVPTVPNLSTLVPGSVDIEADFLIDPSKFTGDPTRLAQSGIRIPFGSGASPALATIGSSSNGLAEYTGTAFDGALQGALLVAQFNNTVTLLNVNDAGTGLEPLIGPGPDGVLGTADDEEVDGDGIYTLLTGLGTPLDVTVNADGSIWVAEFGSDFITVFAPGAGVASDDFDGDGILNVNDPFIRDASNGTAVTLFPGQTLLWDFDPNQDNNLPGPNGYGGGLTGVMVNGSTDFEAFFLEESTLPEQIIKLDNIKFTTAAGGGTTVVEFVSNGDATGTGNTGEYLFHTGLKFAPTVETFNIKWSIINPVLSGPNQQIGGYIGTGDQSNYLKIVATANGAGEIQLVLEDDDVVQAEVFLQADDLFAVPTDEEIFLNLEINPLAATATPTVTYGVGGGATKTVTGGPIDLSGTTVLSTILGNNTVQGKTTGSAVGLYASNVGQPEAPGGSFQATFTDLEITGTGAASSTVLYRLNAGGPEIVAIDGGPNWLADVPFLADPGSNGLAGFPGVEPGASVPVSTPGAIFDTERWDAAGGTEMQYAFEVAPGFYEVRLYMGNGFEGTAAAGARVFDVAIEGAVPASLNNIDLSGTYGNLTGAMLSQVVQVIDGVLNIDFLHDAIDGVENPLVNGLEILQLEGGGGPAVSIVGGPYIVSEAAGQQQISIAADDIVPNAETVEVTFQIVPGTATVLADYAYTSSTAAFDAATGVYTDTVSIAGGSKDVTFFVDIVQDQVAELDEAFTVNIIGTSTNATVGATPSATVTIKDGGGVPPVITTADTVNVLENQALVLDIQSTDADGDTEGNGLTYALGGVDKNFFALDSATGVLSFLNAPDFESPLDSDGNNVYELEVAVTDSDLLSTTQFLNVVVNDVVE
ncbi:hypothetical protein C7293_30395, partial [filamentous cyanobacterium CCT1]